MSDVLSRERVPVTVEIGNNHTDVDDPYTEDMEVVVELSRGEFYDDGRLVVSTWCEGTLGDTEAVADLRRMKGRRGEPVSFEGYIRPEDRRNFDENELPDEVLDQMRSSYSMPGVRIDGEDFERVNEVYENVQEELQVRRRKIQDVENLSVTVERQWQDGKGESHAYHAEGQVEFGESRSLPVHWRNAVDIGFQVFVKDDETSDEFGDDEIDAAVALASENSPISKSMRM